MAILMKKYICPKRVHKRGQSLDEVCVYKFNKDKSVIFLVLCVDDISLIGSNVKLLTWNKGLTSNVIQDERSWKYKLYSWNPNP